MKNYHDEAYVIRQGKKEKIDTPKSGYGKQVIIWQDGKISYYEVSFTEK